MLQRVLDYIADQFLLKYPDAGSIVTSPRGEGYVVDVTHGDQFFRFESEDPSDDDGVFRFRCDALDLTVEFPHPDFLGE